jgi:plasmid stabilization system protein ParE
MTFRILDPAENELREAIAYYEGQREGLGEEFAQEIDRTIQRIVNHPEAGTPLSENIRRGLTKRFP